MKKETTNQFDLGKAYLPPNNFEIECTVLGCMLMQIDKADEGSELKLSVNDFYNDKHRKIFETILEVIERGEKVDLLTVTDHLIRKGYSDEIGGAYYLTSLTMGVVNSSHFGDYVRILKEKTINRSLMNLACNLQAKATSDEDAFDNLMMVENEIEDIVNSFHTSKIKNMSSLVYEINNDLDGGASNGIPTGFKELDKLTSGWAENTFVIVAARPSVGKSAFAMNIGYTANINDVKPVPVLIFSLEMTSKNWATRLASHVTKIDYDRFVKKTLTEDDMKLYADNMEHISKLKLYIDETSCITLNNLKAISRRHVKKNGVGLIIVDYLQLVKSGLSQNNSIREQEISLISRELKALAKELNIPIIALAQLNREVEKRKDPVPLLSDLRESGALEQDADVIIFLNRPVESGSNFADVTIAKNRNGETGYFQVPIEMKYQTFYSEEAWYKQHPHTFSYGVRENKF